MDGNQWPAVENFLRSNRSETVITQPVSASARRQAQAVGMTLTAKTVTLRLIKVVLSTGHIEEAFKILKHRLYLEQFTGELPESIRQDVHAKIFTANLAEALVREAYATLLGDKAARYYPNVTDILNSLKTRLFSWLIQRVPTIKFWR